MRPTTTAVPRAWPIAVAAILALQLALIVAHDPWRDEYQALQIALQTPSLGALFAQLHYEGHPPLWYLVLRGAGAVLPASAVLPAVQAVIATTTTLLILRRAPVARWMRVCLALSPFVLFEYGVIARGASLGAMLLVLFFTAPRCRLRWIAIVLLPMIDFQFGLLSIALLAIAWHDRHWSRAGAALWLVSGLIAAIAVRPAPDAFPAAIVQAPAFELTRLLTVFATMLVPVQRVPDGFGWGGTVPYPFWIVAGPAFLAFCWLQLRGRAFALAVFAAYLIAMVAMSVLVYPLALRHAGILALFLILLMWREAEQGRPPDAMFSVWLGVLGACGVLAAILGFALPFDRAGAAAAFIRSHRLEQRHWVAYPESYGQGVAALLGIEMMSLPRDCTQSFITWNHPVEYDDDAQFAAALDRAVTRYGTLYVLSNRVLPDAAGTAPIAVWDAGYDRTGYRLYRITGPAAGRQPRSCPPARRPLRLQPR